MDMSFIGDAFPGLAGRPPVPSSSSHNNGHYLGGAPLEGCVSVAPTVGSISRLLVADGGNPEGAFHMQAGIRPGNNAPDLELVACPEYNGYCVPEVPVTKATPVPAPVNAEWVPAGFEAAPWR